MRIANVLVVLPALLATVTAQDDPFDDLLSQAFSVYTEITSALASFASEVSIAATASPSTMSPDGGTSASVGSTAGSASASSTSLEDASSTSATLASDSSGTTTATGSGSTSEASVDATATNLDSSTTAGGQTSSLGASAVSSIQGSAAESTSAPASSEVGGGSGTNKLPIILGTVLGALALGLFILALLLCCKRRRRRGSSVRHSALSPGDDEVESWRLNSRSSAASNTRFGLVTPSRHAGTLPLMSEHPAYRRHEHENPFVPVPPPPRRTAPNARAGLTDGAFPGDAPFLEKETRPSGSRTGSFNKTGAVAAGLAGAALGASLMRHHDSGKDEEKAMLNEAPVDAQSQRSVSRKPVPVNKANNSEPWPYEPVSPLDPATDMNELTSPLSPTAETGILAKQSGRPSTESRRSFSRDAARANAAFDSKYSPQEQAVADEAPTPPPHNRGLAGAGTMLAAGALAGVGIAAHRSRSRSSSSSRGRRPPITTSSSEYSSSSNENTYADAVATMPPSNSSPPIASAGAHPQSTYDIAPVPRATRSRRNSSYTNRPAVSSPLTTEYLADAGVPDAPRTSRFNPHRASYPFPHHLAAASAVDDHHYFEPVPSYSARPRSHSASRPQSMRDLSTPFPEDFPTDPAGKAIVGDNGYPHLGVPRRKSGGEYDYAATGPMGPQVLRVPAKIGDGGAASSRVNTMSTADGSNYSWRVSDGMPGGWRRSGDSGRRLRRSDYLVSGGGGGGEEGGERFYGRDGVGYAM